MKTGEFEKPTEFRRAVHHCSPGLEVLGVRKLGRSSRALLNLNGFKTSFLQPRHISRRHRDPLFVRVGLLGHADSQLGIRQAHGEVCRDLA